MQIRKNRANSLKKSVPCLLSFVATFAGIVGTGTVGSAGGGDYYPPAENHSHAYPPLLRLDSIGDSLSKNTTNWKILPWFRRKFGQTTCYAGGIMYHMTEILRERGFDALPSCRYAQDLATTKNILLSLHGVTQRLGPKSLHLVLPGMPASLRSSHYVLSIGGNDLMQAGSLYPILNKIRKSIRIVQQLQRVASVASSPYRHAAILGIEEQMEIQHHLLVDAEEAAHKIAKELSPRYQQILHHLKKMTPPHSQIAFLSPYPIRRYGNSEVINQAMSIVVEQVNIVIRSAIEQANEQDNAKQQDFFLVDIKDIMKRRINMSSDRIHPSKIGSRRIAERLVSQFDFSI